MTIRAPLPPRRWPTCFSALIASRIWRADPNKFAERALYYRKLLQQPNDKAKEVKARFDLAQQLLGAGDSAAAVDEIVKLREFLQKTGIRLTPDYDVQLTELHGLACLRSGEQQNCLNNHNAQSCIYPLRGGGLHVDRRGAECAVAQWSSLLKKAEVR